MAPRHVRALKLGAYINKFLIFISDYNQGMRFDDAMGILYGYIRSGVDDPVFFSKLDELFDHALEIDSSERIIAGTLHGKIENGCLWIEIGNQRYSFLLEDIPEKKFSYRFRDLLAGYIPHYLHRAYNRKLLTSIQHKIGFQYILLKLL